MKALAKLKLRSLESRPAPSKLVAIVIPLSSRPELDEDERISKRHLERHLSHYDRFILVPEGREVDFPGYKVQHFAPRFFGSTMGHAALQMDSGFFEAFLDYQYILMYHLDCLVFRDELTQWCQRGWDYIGAPWFPGDQTPWVTTPHVGNSGFALFNVRSCLRVLYSPNYALHPIKDWRASVARARTLKGKAKAGVFGPIRFMHSFNGVQWHINKWLNRKKASDLFWSEHATIFDPEFRIATVEEGLRFSFETYPSKCFEMNNRQLPFGCHAFGRYERAFWEPHMLPESPSQASNNRQDAA